MESLLWCGAAHSQHLPITHPSFGPRALARGSTMCAERPQTASLEGCHGLLVACLLICSVVGAGVFDQVESSEAQMDPPHSLLWPVPSDAFCDFVELRTCDPFNRALDGATRHADGGAMGHG